MKYTREQVIKSLELHNWSSGARCKNCSYKNHVNCTTDLLTDAIALLKDTDEEAKWVPAESSRYGSMYAGAKCSNCGGGVDGYVSIHFKFCPFCGKRMEEYKPYTAAAVGDKTASADGTSISGFKTADDINIYGYKVEETQHDD